MPDVDRARESLKVIFRAMMDRPALSARPVNDLRTAALALYRFSFQISDQGVEATQKNAI